MLCIHSFFLCFKVAVYAFKFEKKTTKNPVCRFRHMGGERGGGGAGEELRASAPPQIFSKLYSVCERKCLQTPQNNVDLSTYSIETKNRWNQETSTKPKNLSKRELITAKNLRTEELNIQPKSRWKEELKAARNLWKK